MHPYSGTLKLALLPPVRRPHTRDSPRHYVTVTLLHLSNSMLCECTAGHVDILDTYGVSAMHVAAENGHLECLRVLLDAAADCDIGTAEKRPQWVTTTGSAYCGLFVVVVVVIVVVAVVSTYISNRITTSHPYQGVTGCSSDSFDGLS